VKAVNFRTLKRLLYLISAFPVQGKTAPLIELSRHVQFFSELSAEIAQVDSSVEIIIESFLCLCEKNVAGCSCRSLSSWLFDFVKHPARAINPCDDSVQGLSSAFLFGLGTLEASCSISASLIAPVGDGPSSSPHLAAELEVQFRQLALAFERSENFCAAHFAASLRKEEGIQSANVLLFGGMDARLTALEHARYRDDTSEDSDDGSSGGEFAPVSEIRIGRSL
jgi:hypothetical protein